MVTGWGSLQASETAEPTTLNRLFVGSLSSDAKMEKGRAALYMRSGHRHSSGHPSVVRKAQQSGVRCPLLSFPEPPTGLGDLYK